MSDFIERVRRERARSVDLSKQGLKLRLQSSVTVVRSEDLLLSSQVERYLRRNSPPPRFVLHQQPLRAPEP